MPLPSYNPSAYGDVTAASAPRVLCPALYSRLCSLYGSVLIANEGEAMSGSFAWDSTTGQRRYNVASWGETYRVNCPFCRERRHRLWLPHRFGQPDANRELRTGAMYYGVCFNENCLEDHDNRRELYNRIWNVQNGRSTSAPFVVLEGTPTSARLAAVAWPGMMLPLHTVDQTHPAWQYFSRVRNFDERVSRAYNLQLCLQADPRFDLVAGRIVAPFYQHGMMVGWQGRYPADQTPHKGIPKYYTMPGLPKRQVLYNHDRSVDFPFVVVFEGITDVWRFGDPSVAVCGKTLTYGQQMLLQQSWPGKPIVICLDPEAREESAGILHQLRQSGLNPVIDVRLADGWDPAMYTTDALWNTIYTQARDIGVALPIIR